MIDANVKFTQHQIDVHPTLSSQPFSMMSDKKLLFEINNTQPNFNDNMCYFAQSTLQSVDSLVPSGLKYAHFSLLTA